MRTLQGLPMFVKLTMKKTIYCCFFLTFCRESLKEPSMFPQLSLSFQSKRGHLGFGYAYMGLCSEFINIVLRCHLSYSLIVLKQFQSHFGILKYVNSFALYMESAQCLPWLVVLNVERPFCHSLLLSIWKILWPSNVQIFLIAHFGL